MNIISPAKVSFFSILVSVFVLVVVGRASGLGAEKRPHVLQTKPNILVFLTDDQDFSSMDVLRPDGTYLMRNTKELIKDQGVDFSRFYLAYALCCPSRATYLTGQYPHNHGVLDNSGSNGGYQALDHENTLPIWLQGSGYYTGHIGKYMNGYNGGGGPFNLPTQPPGWNEWYSTLVFSKFFNYELMENGVKVQYGSDEVDYNTDVLTGKAITFIETQTTQEKPFFLSVNYIAPHVEANGEFPIPAPRHAGMFSNLPLPTPPSYNESDVSDKPSWVQALPLITDAEKDVIEERYQLRLESLAAVDDGISAIINKLEKLGELNNTVIIFWSDNGLQAGEHRLQNGKRQIYEESARVPLLIRGPGFPKGVVYDDLISNIDLAPTIVDLADAKALKVMDGRSILDLIAKGSSEWRKDLLIENPLWEYRALLTKNYIYAEHDYDKDGVVDDKELYNFVADNCSATPDPYQIESKHADTCYDQMMQAMSERAERLSTCSGRTCK
ncbi:MAG: sulfatase [Patescibacteria group bacterium]